MKILTPGTSIKEENGFTIIEVLIAMVIFSIGVLGIAQMQIQALHADKRAYEQTEAAMWASNQAERFISLPFDDLIALATTGSETVGQNNKYTVSWIITTPPTLTVTREIEITVTWAGSNGPNNLEFNYLKSQII